MAIRKGRCTNYDGCSKADKDEIIEVNELDDFICPECGHELEEIRPPKKKGGSQMPFMIIGGIVVVGIIAALFFLFSGDKEDEIEIVPEVPAEVPDSVATAKDEVVNRNDTLVIKIEGQENLPSEQSVAEEVQIVEPADTAVAVSVVKEINVEQTSPQPAAQPKTTTATKTAQTPKAVQSSTHKLSYGTWTGGMKNGKPHGTGTLTYSTSQTIDSRDSKGRVAQPGEYIVGEWDNGHLVQGRWFKKDGSKEAIILGKAG